MKKYEVIKKFKNFAKGKRQKERIAMDLNELKKLNPFKNYWIQYPQWAGHDPRPSRCRDSEGKLHYPIFISLTVEWVSWQYGDVFVVYES